MMVSLFSLPLVGGGQHRTGFFGISSVSLISSSVRRSAEMIIIVFGFCQNSEFKLYVGCCCKEEYFKKDIIKI